MKVVILAGGLGTRISELSHLKPKPMIRIGDKPILLHIMEYYSKFGFDDFIVLGGYKCDYIMNYFKDLHFNLANNVKFDISTGGYEIANVQSKNWSVQVINSGLTTQTGGRLLWLQDFIREDFLLTYGDGVSNVDIPAVIEMHKSANNVLTLTAVQPEARFGALEIEGQKVFRFDEKPSGDGNWINAGYFCCSPELFDYIRFPEEILERYPMEQLAKIGRLGAYKHSGFWQPMDTLRDKNKLEKNLEMGKAPWV